MISAFLIRPIRPALHPGEPRPNPDRGCPDPRCACIPAAANHVTTGHRGGQLLVHRHRLRADSFARGPVNAARRSTALEGDFGFSAPNATIRPQKSVMRSSSSTFPKVGTRLCSRSCGFARNETGDQAFIADTAQAKRVQSSAQHQFGPDGCAWIPTTVRCATSAAGHTQIRRPARPMVRWFRFRAPVSFGGSARTDTASTTVTMTELT